MRLERFEGCWTAMVTPFNRKGEVDFEGLEKNVRFLIENGSNLVPTGTTGESPTLNWREHDRVITKTAKLAKGKVFVVCRDRIELHRGSLPDSLLFSWQRR